MKKLKIILLLALSVSIFSCEDAYDIKQAGEFSESATFKTVADMKLFLNEVYDRASIRSEIGFTSVFTDEAAIGSQNAGQNIDLYKFVLNSNEGNASTIWLTHYTLINYANRLLRGAALVTPDASDANQVAEYNSIIAQARALRAFGHFQLLTYFSTDLKNDNALGVILMDRVPVIDEKLPRNTNGEVFTLIESDLSFAEANLIDGSGVNAYKFLSQNFIKAFRARMYAYKGDYALAAQYADDVINTSGLSLTSALPIPAGTVGSTSWNSAYYGSASINPYRRMLADLDRGEVIFALDRPVGKEAVGGLFYFNRTNLTGGPFHDMGRNLFNLLEVNPGDIRRRAFIDPTSLIDPNYVTNPNYKASDVLCIDKYPGKSGAELNNDLKVFRLSEMYFIKAEALASTGNINGPLNSVASMLKQIRDKRNYLNPNQPLPVYASVTEAWADILQERRIELCFEGHRYIDIKRLGALANASIDRFTRDCDNIPTCTLPVSDYRFTMPITINEIIGNSNIQQNPGY